MALYRRKDEDYGSSVRMITWLRSTSPPGSKKVLPHPSKGIARECLEPDRIAGVKQRLFVSFPDGTGKYLPIRRVRFSRTEFDCESASGSQVAMWPYPAGTTSWTGPWGLDSAWFRGLVGSFTRSSVWDTDPWEVSQDTRNRAILNCLSQLSAPKHLDAGVFIGELSETVKFLRKPMNSLVELLGDLSDTIFRKVRKNVYTKRGSSSTSQQIAKSINPAEFISVAANTWMEYRYAVMPVVYDIVGAATLINEGLPKMDKDLRRVVGKAVEAPYNYSGVSGLEGVGDVYPQGISRLMFKRTRVAYALMRYRYRPYMKDAIYLASLGLSPTQVLSTAWELVPLSFVVDWAFMVGPWLKALEPKPWIEKLDSCLTVTEALEMKVENATWNMGSGNVTLPAGKAFRQRMIRELDTLDLSSFTPPLTGKALSIKRQIDALSMSWGVLTNKLAPLKRGLAKHSR